MKKFVTTSLLMSLIVLLTAQKSGDFRIGLGFDPFDFRGVGPSLKYYSPAGMAIQGELIFNTWGDNVNFHSNIVRRMPTNLDPKKMVPYTGIGINLIYNSSFLTLTSRPNGKWVKAAPYVDYVLGMDLPYGKSGWVIHGEWRPKMLLGSPTLRQAGYNRFVLIEMGLGIRYQFNQGTLKKS